MSDTIIPVTEGSSGIIHEIHHRRLGPGDGLSTLPGGSNGIAFPEDISNFTASDLVYNPVDGVFTSTVDELCVCVSYELHFVVDNSNVQNSGFSRFGVLQPIYDGASTSYVNTFGFSRFLTNWTVDPLNNSRIYANYSVVLKFIIRRAGESFYLRYFPQNAGQTNFLRNYSEVQIKTERSA